MLYLFLDDLVLSGELAALQIQPDEGDHDADDEDGKTYPGAYVCPCACTPGCVPSEADGVADHEGEYHSKGCRALAHGQTLLPAAGDSVQDWRPASCVPKNRRL